MRRQHTGAALSLALAAVLVAACTAGSEPSLQPADSPRPTATPAEDSALADPQDAGLAFAVVTHGATSDPFWEIVESGAEDAGAAHAIQVEYQSDPDPAGQARLIDAAVSAQVDGLIVSLSDPAALGEPMARAQAADIPIVTINEGAESSTEFGALTHVGQSDLAAGRGAGQRLREAGVTTLLCVIQDSGDPTLEERCQGAADGFGGADNAVINLTVNGGDLAAAAATVASELSTEPRIDGVLTLSASVASATEAALREAGSTATLATFELDPDVTQGIRAGEVLFAVDQQEYLQGYLPVVFLAVFLRTGTIAGAGQPVPTGPRYVTADNVDSVVNLSVTGGR